jgi:hypothetical protein
LVTAFLTSVLCSGCKRPTFPPTSEKKEDQSLAGRIAGKVRQTVTAIEMHDLHLFIETQAIDGMPDAATIRDYAKKENPKLSKLLEDGTIVLTGIKHRQGVWAYEKDAPTKGGWVVTDKGEQQMTAEELNRALGK